jgi:hypothetical protein
LRALLSLLSFEARRHIFEARVFEANQHDAAALDDEEDDTMLVEVPADDVLGGSIFLGSCPPGARRNPRLPGLNAPGPVVALRIVYTGAGQVGADAGGLTRDFFTRILAEILDPNRALFRRAPEGRWKGFSEPNPGSGIQEDHEARTRCVE